MNLDKFAADLIEALLKDFCETFPRARDVVATMDGDVYGWRVARAEALADRLKREMLLAPPPRAIDLNAIIKAALRDEFAMRAPPVPEVFPMPELRGMEYQSTVTAGWPSEVMEKWHGWGDWLTEEEIEPELIAKFKAARAEMEAIVRRNEDRKRAAFLKRETDWRWAFADAMLASRNPEPKSDDPIVAAATERQEEIAS